MIKHLCATNDRNGNPQRLYALIDEEGEMLAAWDEGYYGHQAVPGPWRDAAYQACRTSITVKEYKQILRSVPSPDYAHDVPGYSHLRPQAAF